MFKLQHWTTMVMCGALLTGAACKQEEPPAPPKPSVAPLADTALRKTPTGTPQLPPGHPPIDGQQQQQPSAGPIPPGAEMPPDHPPIDGVMTGRQNASGNGLPPGHPEVGGQAQPSGGAAGGMPAMPGALPSGDEKLLAEAPTAFAGITLTPPAGWKAFDAGSGPMAPVAAFLLPGAEGDAATARLTYFPNMRDMPQMVEMNLNRWYRQVQQPDGKATSDVATKNVFEANGATITLVDMPGTIDGTPDQRMIAAIIEHPQGPHFLKVAGPDATVAEWHDDVVSYLKSVELTP